MQLKHSKDKAIPSSLGFHPEALAVGDKLDVAVKVSSV